MLDEPEKPTNEANEHLLWLDQIGLKDIAKVGGKNSSLGEMLRHLTGKGIRVPEGFAITTKAFRWFVEEAGLDEAVETSLKGVDPDELTALISVSKAEKLLGEKKALAPLVATKQGNPSVVKARTK